MDNCSLLGLKEGCFESPCKDFHFQEKLHMKLTKEVCVRKISYDNLYIFVIESSEKISKESISGVIYGLDKDKSYMYCVDDFHKADAVEFGQSGEIKISFILQGLNFIFLWEGKENCTVFLTEKGFNDKSFGEWNADTRIANLANSECKILQIDIDGITITGNSKFPLRGNLPVGIYLNCRNNVKVTDVSISGFLNEILIANSNNISITNCKLSAGGIGVNLINSEHIQIDETGISFPSDSGISLYKCCKCSIEGCPIGLSLDSAIFLEKSTDNNILGNFLNSGTIGIRLKYKSDNNNVSYNYINSMEYGIITSKGSNENKLNNNSITSAINSIVLEDSAASEAISNNVTCCEKGISLFYSYKCKTYMNRIQCSKIYAIEVEASSEAVIDSNWIFENNTGVYMDNTDKCMLVKNMLWNNKEQGVLLRNSIDTILNDNDFSNNVKYGLNVMYCTFSEVYHNNFESNGTECFVHGKGNIFSKSLPVGGNYWSSFRNESGTYKIIEDGIDEFPWQSKNGWVKYMGE